MLHESEVEVDMAKNLEDLLNVTADMESFYARGDKLSDWIAQHGEGELSEDELTFVAAAGTRPSYQAFLEKYHLDKDR